MAKKKMKTTKVKLKNVNGRILHVIEVKTRADYFVSTQRFVGLAVKEAVRKGLDLTKVNLRYADLSDLDLGGHNFYGADFSNADLTRTKLNNCLLVGASFYEAKFTLTNLSGANLAETYLGDAKFKDITFTHLIGDGEYFKTIQGWDWHIVYTKTHMAIGCRQYKLSEWWKFSSKEIRNMATGATRFWTKAKPMLQEIIKRNKAG